MKRKIPVSLFFCGLKTPPDPVPQEPDPDYGDMFMSLDLVVVDHTQVPGIYGRNKDSFAKRLAFMHPEAVVSFKAMQGQIALSDMWRASLSSLARKYPPDRPMRKGTQPPAYSGHNYGLSIDIAVSRILKAMAITKPGLDALMASHGWYCHRLDGRRKREEWHYNYLGDDSGRWLARAGRSTAGAIEAKIQSLYAPYWSPTHEQLQRYLSYLKIYDGEIDGIIGARSKTAIRVFQGAWHLKKDGIAGAKTSRTLAFRCAELRHPELSKLRNVQQRIT